MRNKGQFSIIAALLVAVVLIATVVVTYSTIRYSPIQDQPQLLSAIDETNFAIKQILGFTVGYYGSVLKVTGNLSFAKDLAMSYLHSGMVNIANMHPEWGASFNLANSTLYAYWYMNTSYSMGDLAVTYNLTGLGIYGMAYETSCCLTVQIRETLSENQTELIVTVDEGEPLINLGKQKFKFYRYSFANSAWELVSPTSEPTIFANGTYIIDIPPNVDPYSYLIQVEDTRGLVVVASSFSHYTCTFTWNSTLYSTLQDEMLVVELLQNGTMRWLGQNLQLATQAKPLPPVPVRSLRVNETINGIDREVPFQVEDWASQYRIPLGLTSNASVFGNRMMLVFLVNKNTSKATIWWDGSDTATQTPYGYVNRYFKGDDPDGGLLTNGILTLNVITSGDDFQIESTLGTSQNTARFMRINNEWSVYGAEPAFAIHHGIVRDIIHQEAEWRWGADNCPDLYAHIVLTLPANVTYYTYQLRLMFVESNKDRTIADLCPVRIVVSNGLPQTENGTANGYPIVSNVGGLFYNFSLAAFQHHWSQFTSESQGAGIMYTDSANQMLYVFDDLAGYKTAALKISNSTSRTIELLPVSMASVSFQYALDVTWHGAIAAFDDTTPLYEEQNGDRTGLWILVEYPPEITVTTES